MTETVVLTISGARGPAGATGATGATGAGTNDAWVTKASAATINMTSAGRHVKITGTTPVTAFSGLSDGQELVTRFSAACPLTHGAGSFELLGAANMTAIAGDVAEWIQDGSVTRMVAYWVGAVRYDTAAQGLSGAQRDNARTNLGLGGGWSNLAAAASCDLGSIAGPNINIIASSTFTAVVVNGLMTVSGGVTGAALALTDSLLFTNSASIQPHSMAITAMSPTSPYTGTGGNGTYGIPAENASSGSFSAFKVITSFGSSAQTGERKRLKFNGPTVVSVNSNIKGLNNEQFYAMCYAGDQMDAVYEGAGVWRCTWFPAQFMEVKGFNGDPGFGRYAWGSFTDFETAFPAFRVNEHNQRPKVECRSAFVREVGDTAEWGFYAASGSVAAPDQVGAYYAMASLYCLGTNPIAQQATYGLFDGKYAQDALNSASGLNPNYYFDYVPRCGIDFVSFEASTATARGSGLAFYTIPTGKDAPFYRGWWSPGGSLYIAGRGAYEAYSGTLGYPYTYNSGTYPYARRAPGGVNMAEFTPSVALGVCAGEALGTQRAIGFYKFEYRTTKATGMEWGWDYSADEAVQGVVASGSFTAKWAWTAARFGPVADLGSDLGSSAKRWQSVYAQNLELTRATDANVLRVENTLSSFSNDLIQAKLHASAGDGINFLQTDRGGDVKHRLKANGDGTCDGSWAGGGADVAEYLPAALVDVDGHGIVRVGAAIVGALSSRPALVSNYAEGRESDPAYVLVGLLGQLELPAAAGKDARWVKLDDVDVDTELWLVR